MKFLILKNNYEKIFIDNTEKNRKLLFNKLLEGKFPLTTEIVIGLSKKIELNL